MDVIPRVGTCPHGADSGYPDRGTGSSHWSTREVLLHVPTCKPWLHVRIAALGRGTTNALGSPSLSTSCKPFSGGRVCLSSRGLLRLSQRVLYKQQKPAVRHPPNCMLVVRRGLIKGHGLTHVFTGSSRTS